MITVISRLIIIKCENISNKKYADYSNERKLNFICSSCILKQLPEGFKINNEENQVKSSEEEFTFQGDDLKDTLITSKNFGRF